jgi:hypothetical protein
LPADEAAPGEVARGDLTFGGAVLGFLKVVGSFFVLPATSLVGIYRELARIGAKQGAFSSDATPTPFLTWILIAMRMLFPILTFLWIIGATLLGFTAGHQDMFSRLMGRQEGVASHLQAGLTAFITSAIMGFFFLWIANFYLDLLSIFVNINQKVTDIHHEIGERQGESAA